LLRVPLTGPRPRRGRRSRARFSLDLQEPGQRPTRLLGQRRSWPRAGRSVRPDNAIGSPTAPWIPDRSISTVRRNRQSRTDFDVLDIWRHPGPPRLLAHLGGELGAQRCGVGVRVYRIVQCHSKLHVRQWRAKDSRPLVHPCRQKFSLRSTLWRLSRCHQTKLSSVPVRVGALTDGISDTPSVSSGN